MISEEPSISLFLKSSINNLAENCEFISNFLLIVELFFHEIIKFHAVRVTEPAEQVRTNEERWNNCSRLRYVMFISAWKSVRS